MNKIIYFDNASTTKIDSRVLLKMFKFLKKKYGNSSSIDHKIGNEINNIIEKKRKSISKILKCKSKEIIFTSSSTEANNLAIKGFAFSNEKIKTFLTLKTEHKSVINAYKRINNFGHKIIYLNVKKNGICKIEDIKKKIKKEKIDMISIMWVNNEIGVIQKIRKIGLLCYKNKIVFHVDATQAFGKLNINLKKTNIDMMSISSHKIYGPQGIGLLYKKKTVNLIPEIQGGGQEQNLRSGTVATHLVIGFCEAMKISYFRIKKYNKKIKKISNFLKKKLLSIEDTRINGSTKRRIPHNINISFGSVEGESLMMKMKNIAVSSGSACNSLNLEPSYVLKYIKVPSHMIHNSIRITIGKYNTIREAKYLFKKIDKSVKELRKISPLWEMYKKGISFKKKFNEIQ